MTKTIQFLTNLHKLCINLLNSAATTECQSNAISKQHRLLIIDRNNKQSLIQQHLFVYSCPTAHSSAAIFTKLQIQVHTGPGKKWLDFRGHWVKGQSRSEDQENVADSTARKPLNQKLEQIVTVLGRWTMFQSHWIKGQGWLHKFRLALDLWWILLLLLLMMMMMMTMLLREERPMCPYKKYLYSGTSCWQAVTQFTQPFTDSTHFVVRVHDVRLIW